MQREVTLIIPIRNRDPERIGNVIGSLREKDGDLDAIVVDYGSDRRHIEEYESLAKDLGFELEKMAAMGLPWSQARAINRGARLTTTEYVAISDVDLVYGSDPIGYCLAQGREDVSYHIDTFWLDKNGDRRKARAAGHGSPGGFQFIHRSAFDKAGGYDERIVYWGLEDRDWYVRLEHLGYEQIWLPEGHRAYHVWHPRSETRGMRPVTASYDSASFCMANIVAPKLAQDWGRALRKEDRPILELIDSGEPPVEVRIEPNLIASHDYFQAIWNSRSSGRFIRIDAGPRLIPRPLDGWRDAARSLMRPLSALTGNTIVDKVNDNADYLYRMIPVLYEHGLRDHFFSPTFESVSLLWE